MYHIVAFNRIMYISCIDLSHTVHTPAVAMLYELRVLYFD